MGKENKRRGYVSDADEILEELNNINPVDDEYEEELGNIDVVEELEEIPVMGSQNTIEETEEENNVNQELLKEIERLRREALEKDATIKELSHVKVIEDNKKEKAVVDAKWIDTKYKKAGSSPIYGLLTTEDLNEHLQDFNEVFYAKPLGNDYKIRGSITLEFKDAAIQNTITEVLRYSAAVCKADAQERVAKKYKGDNALIKEETLYIHGQIDKFIEGFKYTTINDMISDGSYNTIAELLGYYKDTIKEKNPNLTDSNINEIAEATVSGVIGANFESVRKIIDSERVTAIFVCFTNGSRPNTRENGVEFADEALLRKILSPLCGSNLMFIEDKDNEQINFIVDTRKLLFLLQDMYKKEMFARSKDVNKNQYRLLGTLFKKMTGTQAIQIEYKLEV